MYFSDQIPLCLPFCDFYHTCTDYNYVFHFKLCNLEIFNDPCVVDARFAHVRDYKIMYPDPGAFISNYTSRHISWRNAQLKTWLLIKVLPNQFVLVQYIVSSSYITWFSRAEDWSHRGYEHSIYCFGWCTLFSFPFDLNSYAISSLFPVMMILPDSNVHCEIALLCKHLNCNDLLKFQKIC